MNSFKLNPLYRSIAVAAALSAACFTPMAMAEDATSAPQPFAGVEVKVTEGLEVAAACQPFTMSDADTELSEKVMAALRADPELRGRIGVTVLDGQVLLSGTVASVPMIYRAVETSRKITGSTRVNADRLDKGYV